MLRDRCTPLCLVQEVQKQTLMSGRVNLEPQGLWPTVVLPTQQGCSWFAALESGVLPTQGLDMLPADGHDDAEL